MAEQSVVNVKESVQGILDTIEKEREREIVSRRFGLFDRKETLEQIGELLGITRERVRQLEKAAVARLKTQASEGKLANVTSLDEAITAIIAEQGGAIRVSDLSAKLTEENGRLDQSRVAFLTKLCPSLVTLDENDFYFQAAALSKEYTDKKLKQKIQEVIDAIKKIDKPCGISDVTKELGSENDNTTAALASLSKKLATLNGRWGLIKWPMVNPKNIRDKIYVILYESGKHMHFGDIAKEIKKSDFKRKDVTTQAIHNELIKDKRFVLVGRGIYALKEWGYKKGTVADVITEVLKEAGEPLHRDEIVKRVLKDRYVKETTILLNLQGKPQFKRVAKATYTLAEEK